MSTILFYDTETNGLPRWDLAADDPAQPRLVDLGAILCDADTGAELARFESIVRPDGWTIGADMVKIHGITQAIAMRVGKPVDQVLDAFDLLERRANTIATYNLRFDEKVMRGERRRLGRPDGFGMIPVFCCLKGARALCKLPKGKPPKLAEAFEILVGRKHEGAHRAIVDARAAADIYFAARSNPLFMEKGANFKTNQERAA